jgi:hypothetical protein
MRSACVATLAAALTLASACNRGVPEGVLDPENELPFGHVDHPPANAGISAQTVVAGWAMDDREVREVRVYVDGRLAEVTPLNTERSDVSKVFPQYAHASHRHGWTTSVVFEAPGPHTILVQAVDSNGATRDIGSVPVVSVDK